MPLIQWTDALSVGHDEIDDDHKQFINILNELHDRIEAGYERDRIQASFTRLVEYAHYHFNHEEQIMEAVCYADMDIHKLQHRELTDNATELHEAYKQGDDSVLEIVIPFVRNWLTNHVMQDDKTFGEALSETQCSINKK